MLHLRQMHGPALALLLAACAPRGGQPPATGAAPTATAAAAPAAPAAAATTLRHATFTLESRAVGERRTINVYTPPAYERERGASFPVLYMPDGGVEEDFPRVARTVDSLIALGEIAPVLVVGIQNTERRRDMTGPTTVAKDSTIAPRVGGSAAFRRFIRDELMPEVRARYRVTDETTIVGESLAGLFIVETFLLEPALFRRYVALDPSVWWNGGELVRTADARLGALSGLERTLYLSTSREPSTAEGSAALAALLRAQAPAGTTTVYEPRPDLEHATIYRGEGPRALARVLGRAGAR